MRSIKVVFDWRAQQVLILGIFYGGRNIQPGVLDE